MDQVDSEPVADNVNRLLEGVAVVGDYPGFEELVGDGNGQGQQGEDDESRPSPSLRRPVGDRAIRRVCGMRFSGVQ
jgi:hypothetical protein